MIVEVRVPSSAGMSSLDEIKRITRSCPGEHDVRVVVVRDRAVIGTMVLGPEWRCDGGELCVALLAEFGGVQLQAR